MTVVEYYKESKTAPVVEWMKKVDPIILVEVKAMMMMLEEYGHKLERPHAAPLRDKIHELIIKTERGQFRILYFFHGKKAIILTHVFAKKTKAVPNREIELAVKRMKKFKVDPEKHTL